MKFLLGSDSILKYKKYDDINTEYEYLDENVLIYDSTYDKFDNLHLVYLQKNGELNHVIFNEEGKSESKIAKFDVLSNIYYQISILIVNGNLNIFYAYSNKINSNIFSLHHVILKSTGQEKYNIVRFVSKKNNRSFVANSDTSSNIHILYSTITDSFSYIFYTYFNPYKNQWLQNPVMMSRPERKSDYPSILVDSSDNIHCIWWEKSTDGYVLRYKKMNQTGKKLYKWIEINIPNIVQERPYSSIYEKKDSLYIKCDEVILISNNSGNNWIIEKIDSPSKDEVKLVEAVEEKVVVENISDEKVRNQEAIEDIIDEIEDYLVEDLDDIIKDSKGVMEDKEEMTIDMNIVNFEQLLEEIENINYYISQIMDNQLLLNAKLNALEEQLKNPSKTKGLKKFFIF